MKKIDYATFTSGNEKSSPKKVNVRNAFIEEFTVSEENLGNMYTDRNILVNFLRVVIYLALVLS